ncbi:MAG: tRNA uridine-5-carboxymethylaminomethyl(34) synthesis GTPase MnmE [Opitutaceae bacterium]|nr:tRNA uridine-5-carboxymethylaminomethyl(34) synthesis GTPase MnmE [Opitutaceae bacterium]
MNQDGSTIVALATPVGVSAIALLRISGPLCRAWAAGGLFGRTLVPRRAHHLDYLALDGRLLDDVVVVSYLAPASYTGEDCLELSCHGNPLIAQRLVEDLCARGCRLAQPGEFTQRAFLSGRLDLSQAEAVMDVIQARSDRSLAVAQKQLKGSLGRHLLPLQRALLDAAAQVEAYIDFPDEDLPPEDQAKVKAELEAVLRGTRQLLATRHYGEMLRDGIRTVIVGAPNAGKSSLLNRLVGFERALVSPEPGTTRDFLEAWIRVGPHALRLIDTAGLNRLPLSELEARGIALTRTQLAEADLVLWVVDLSDDSPALSIPPPELVAMLSPDKVLVVGNKLDRLEQAVLGSECDAAARRAMVRAQAEGKLSRVWSVPDGVQLGAPLVVSAQTGAGVDALVERIVGWADAFQLEVGDEVIAIGLRHAQALERAQESLGRALGQLVPGGLKATELLASDIRGSLEALGEILGKYDHERMLDRLFATFCIGK